MKKKKSGNIGTVIIVTATLGLAVGIVCFNVVRGIFWFTGYLTPMQRNRYRRDSLKALEEKYRDHDFSVDTYFGSGEYGYYLNIYGKDENGIEFDVQWVEGEMQDRYHEEWNKFYYGEKLVEYQNTLRDKYFPQIPYVDTYEYSDEESFHFVSGPYRDVFFESMDEAVEGTKCCSFDTDVTYKGIDLDTADDEELERFAESMADSLIWLYEETGYYSIWIEPFYYKGYDESGDPVKSREELVEDIIKRAKRRREW